MVCLGLVSGSFPKEALHFEKIWDVGSLVIKMVHPGGRGRRQSKKPRWRRKKAGLK